MSTTVEQAVRPDGVTVGSWVRVPVGRKELVLEIRAADDNGWLDQRGVRRDWAGVSLLSAGGSGAVPEPYASMHTGTVPAEGGPEPGFVVIPRAMVVPSPLNPRKSFDPVGLDELAESIRQHGILQPLVVRPGAGGVYELIAGERRWRASELAGLERVPVVVRTNLDDLTVVRMMYEENERRRSLNPVERAEALAKLQELGRTQAQIAEELGIGQPQVARILSVLKLPAVVQTWVAEGKISQTHAGWLVRWAAFPAVEKLAELLANEPIAVNRLDKGVPYGWGNEVVSAKLGKRVDYNTPFRATCERCPFGALLQDEYANNRTCLKVEHFVELETAHREAERERAAQAEELCKSGEAQNLSTLPARSYELIRGTPPEGCTAECACRGEAIDWNGGVVPICLKPKRFRELVAAAEKEAARVRAEALRPRLVTIEERLQAPALDPRAAVILAYRTLAEMGSPWLQKLALDRLGVDLQESWFESWRGWEGSRGPAYAALGTVDPDRLLRFAVEARLRRAAEGLKNAPNSGAEEFWWFVGGTPTEGGGQLVLETAATEADPYLRCAQCGSDFTADNSGRVVEVEEAGRAVQWCERCLGTAEGEAELDGDE